MNYTHVDWVLTHVCLMKIFGRGWQYSLFNITKYKFILQFMRNTNAHCLPLSGYLLEERFRRIPLSKRGSVNYGKGPILLTILFFTVYNITVTTATVILLKLSITVCLLAFFRGKLTRVFCKRTRCRGREEVKTSKADSSKQSAKQN